MTTLEVIRSSIGGWDVRERGEAFARTHHDDRDEAVEAARRLVQAGEADQVTVREDVVEDLASTDRGFRSAWWYFTLMTVAVIGLVVLLSALGIAA